MIVLISSSIAFALAALSPYRHSVAFLGLHAGEAPATSFARHGGALCEPHGRFKSSHMVPRRNFWEDVSRKIALNPLI